MTERSEQRSFEPFLCLDLGSVQGGIYALRNDCERSEQRSFEPFLCLDLGSVQGGIYALRNAHMRTTLSQKFPKHCL